MVYVFLFLCLIILIAALSWFITRIMHGHGTAQASADTNLRTQKDEDGKTIFVRCPICNTPLAKSDELVSKIFHPMNVPDQIMHVLGCPHCYPVPEQGIKRECPVCHKPLPLKEHLIARLFNYTNKKKHVIITGCSYGCINRK
jgi:endogenous inhibitor of DNA gyrase (YacG/DUF329 family)